MNTTSVDTVHCSSVVSRDVPMTGIFTPGNTTSQAGLSTYIGLIDESLVGSSADSCPTLRSRRGSFDRADGPPGGLRSVKGVAVRRGGLPSG